ncbi:putative ergosterol biosynthetic protein 28 [Trichoplax sp. H2]|uniref:Ergosterol biosynthetic protein 28 n=1 Tax=Trichoplax adhaerens TaxID=10228 RepID=B3S0S4_TRIAD|nr:hypothetical protein TRIADDRAFT_57153 [Trichoplax adhaerens]EDV23692.1 hypothetical protein TRIADDRAFT_57153 [Trichoplax adhaerens]RDD44307.1 putative ergosterol biosynthetic protein 28 [Trichoplax sp. H2]|eukprot:XP_002113218.1 hypothetical protein TRIADDRAFT_57153 [Trichoplax adhaerens]
MAALITALRLWIGMIATIAFVNSTQCYLQGEFVHQRMYTETKEATLLQARTFGTWTLLASVIRIYCAFDIYNKTLYMVTFWSFIIVLAHLLAECYIYHTAAFTPGVIAPLIISSLSSVWMILAYPSITNGSESKAKSN